MSARHEFHVEGDKGYPVALHLNRPYPLLKTVVTRTGRGATTDEDDLLFEHYVAPETDGHLWPSEENE